MKNIDKDILKFAIPNIISNITVPLLGFVDMALMGHLQSPIYIGAISLGTVIFNFIYWSLGFLRMSTSGLTAQAYGAKDELYAAKLLTKALFIAVTVGIIILLFRNQIAQTGLGILEGSEAVKKEALVYFRIRIWAAPASIGIFALSGWFLGMHHAKIPMIVAVASNVINIFISVVLVKYFGYTADGVATGTVIAQYSGLAIYIIYLVTIHRNLLQHIRLKNILPFQEFKNFMSISGDIFIRTLLVIIVFTWFTSESAAQGNEILAVNSLFREFLMFFSFLMDGFAFASEPLSGNYIGSGNRNKIKALVNRLFKWGFLITFIMTLIYALAGKYIMGLLTDQQVILNAASEYRIYIILIPVACFSSFLWDGIYIGVTASRQMLISIAISTFAIFFPVYYLLRPFNENHGLWIAMLLFMFTRGIYLWFASKKYVYNSNKKALS